MIGSGCSGTNEKQLASIKAIAYFLNIDISEQQVTEIAKHIFSKNAHTFRKGQIGDWQHCFSAERKKVFKEVAGSALIKFGDEDGYSW